ncbi:MAG TPA: hypothetical protein VEL09_09755, partial [Burkholderiales bacterium]|nr:hypothetical protein [Burkholderiales bacterium]
ALFANDIIYGGLGSDSIHGGAGEDAISGAEAPVLSFVDNYNQAGVKIGGPIESDYSRPVNPGNVLGYSPTTTKFALYDANDPLRKILLTAAGALSKTGVGLEWALNFDENEGPLDTKWAVGTAFPAVPTDGDDAIFGDLGHDWLVGGTGRDSLWAGWGDDYLQADDKLTTSGGLNNGPDTNPSWEDLAFGGEGLDVLVANTGGDRLVDMDGEFNTFAVPFNPFGPPTVLSRATQPDMEALLYALSKSQGADQTLIAQYGGAAARNGEPFGEIALVKQGDAAFGAQHGGPRDPQGPLTQASRDVRVSAGNLPLWQSVADPDTVTTDPDSQPSITESMLAPIVEAAKRRWTDALGAGDSRLAVLDSVTVHVGDLPQDEIGATLGYDIYIDGSAAGRGWFVDSSPAESSEFAARLDRDVLAALPGSAAFAHMDLLTIVTHELGHVLGFDHDDTGRIAVMTEAVDSGVRYLLAPGGRSPVGTDAGPARSLAALPRFDLEAGSSGAGSGARIDWQAPAGEGWSVQLSPYGPVKAAKGAAPAVSDFLVKPARDRAGAQDPGYDGMGRALLGDKAKSALLGDKGRIGR